MVLKSPYNWTQLGLCMFARARPRARPRGVANLGTSSLVPENGRFSNFSTGIATGTDYSFVYHWGV
eukprot:COSAG02_NODE_48686_length_332_cov_0.652361_1_plen_65_part_10